MPDPRVIKKYSNRSLYDTERSMYISLTDLKQYVLDDVEFVVREARTKADITRQVLLQIIAEEENAGKPIFSTAVLRRFIRIYGNSAAAPFNTYIEELSNILDLQTRQFLDQLHARPELNPLSAWSEIFKRNLDIWQETADKLVQASGREVKPPVDDS
jgi:polyhydroxyalkanoate synthesis repressor PhaR